MLISTSNTLKLYTTGGGWLGLSVPENYIPSGSLNVAIPIDTDIQCTLQATSITSDSSDNLYVSGTVSGGYYPHSYTGSVTFIYNPTLSTTDIIAANILDGVTLLLSIGNNIPAFDQMLVHDKKLYAGGSLQAGTLALYSYDGTTWLSLTETVTSSINKLFATNSIPTAVLRSPVAIPPTYSADTVFYLESASIVSATHPRKQLIEETITALKNGGLWDKLDMMFIKGNPFEALPFCDIKRGSYVGYYNNVNTAFVPDIDAVNMTLSSASIGVYSAAIPTTRTPSTTSANYIASLNQSDMYGEWQAVGSGMNAFVRKIITNGTDVYACGNFTTAGGNTVGRVAMWDGNTWTAVGSGLTNDFVNDIAFDSLGNLYASGYFTTICGVAANRIAKWDGANWSALGTGLAGGTGTLVGYCLAIDSNDNVFVGGRFTTAGGISANRVAKWDGANWSALGTGYVGGDGSSFIYSIAIDSVDNVYVGGDDLMTSIGGTSVTSVAMWDGLAWSALGAGLSHTTPSSLYVGSIVIDKTVDVVYVGGRFTTAGGSSVSNIAAWDGATWSAMSSGFGTEVEVSISPSQEIYAADNSNVYKWSGVIWEDLGGTAADTIAIDTNDKIYIGGGFTTVPLTHNLGCYVGATTTNSSSSLMVDIDTGTLLAKVNSDTYTTSPATSASSGLLVCTTTSNTQEIWVNGVSVASSVVAPTSLTSLEIFNSRENTSSSNTKQINTSNYAVFAGAYLSGAEQLTLKAILENYFNTTTYQ